MPSDKLPERIINPESPEEIQARLGTVSDSMTVDQATHYNRRASLYNKQSESPFRAARYQRMDAYYYKRLEKLLQPGGLNYLDFGCATATHTKQFLVGLTSNRVNEGYGIDISPKNIELAVQELPEFHFISGGAGKIDFDHQFDLITSFYHVLGHLSEEELELFFRNAARALNFGGILCFDVQKMMGEGGKRYQTYIIHHPDNPNMVIRDEDGQPLVGSMGTFTKEHLVKLAKKNNLEIVEIADIDIVKPDEESHEFAVILRKKALY